MEKHGPVPFTEKGFVPFSRGGEVKNRQNPPPHRLTPLPSCRAGEATSGRHLGSGRAEAARAPGAIFEPGTGDTAAAAAARRPPGARRGSCMAGQRWAPARPGQGPC